MSRADVLDTPVGEMMDMLSCFYVTHGVAVEIHRKKSLDYDEAIMLK